ncbi:MAG: hypothetical protein IPG92_15720 [Flavobacteriales bacterium]|nr:hypothetical protein [Flavobacteriales bacterium]
MIATLLANLLRFVMLLLVQVLVLDHLDMARGWMVPYLYVLILLMLPFELPAWGHCSRERSRAWSWTSSATHRACT